MNRLDYTQNCVLARVYAKRMLDHTRIGRMINAASAEEAFKLLMETEYTKSMEDVNDVYDYDTLLGNEMQRIYKIGDELLPDKEIFQILVYKYEFHNMRVIAKEIATGNNFENLYLEVSSFNPQKVKEQFINGHYSNIDEYVVNTLSKAIDAYEVDRNSQAIDFSIDRDYFHILVGAGEKTGVEMIVDYVRAMVDFYNVSALIRAQKHGIANLQNLDSMLVRGGDIDIDKLKALNNAEVDRIMELVKFGSKGKFMLTGLNAYKETGSLEVLEDARADYLALISGDTRYEHFGPEPIFAYMLQKEKELSIVRIILISKLNGISAKEIRERLGEEYV